MAGKNKKKGGKGDVASSEKKVNFNGDAIKMNGSINGNGIKSTKSGMKHSYSANTLSRVEREKITLFGQPITTIHYCIREIGHILIDFLYSLMRQKILLLGVALLFAGMYYSYITPGDHQRIISLIEKKITWWTWWVFLGVLSSIGLGSGLHTFLIYLGPHIAKVTLAAYECNSLDFPDPYPDSIVCPEVRRSSTVAITLWEIVSKVRVESLLWGAGTALGELPPYFMARAARLSGQEPDDEEYREFIELMNANKQGNKDELSWTDRGKAWVERFISRVGFPGILLFASIPNPLFDLAGITCGHFLVPFWSFFGATLIGKALVKMHVQMLFVIVAFSEHHVENLINLLKKIPYIGESIRQPIKDLLQKQKDTLHGTGHHEQSVTWLQWTLSVIVTCMILGFLVSIINSLAQRYHKRDYERSKLKMQ